jgi:hypothetical protein
LLLFLFFACDPGTTNEQVVYESHTLKLNTKVVLCHKSNTISVGKNALQAHLDHGDTLGECSAKTYVPDDNFEQNLIDLGYDDILDDYVLTSAINTLTSLSLTSVGEADIFYENEINDYTGIEDFTALETFILRGMYPVTGEMLDLSQNINIKTLNFYCTAIDGIDLSSNTALEEITVTGGDDGTCAAYVRNMDFSNNHNLRTIGFAYVSAYDINPVLSTATSLEDFTLFLSDHEQLDFTNNPNLKILSIVNYENRTEFIDLKNGANNIIQSITLDAIVFDPSHPVLCIQADDPSYIETVVVTGSYYEPIEYTVSSDCGF